MERAGADPGVRRRDVLLAGGLGALGAGLGGLGGPAGLGGVDAAAAATRPPLPRFVSMPDFLNGDVGDLSGLATWDGGANSINESWRAAVDRVLGFVAGHHPRAVLVAGDLVEGRWNVDSDDRRLFGPVSAGTTPAEVRACEEAIATAGGVYYGHYRRLFAERGLPLYPALGDHEVLDDRSGPLDQRWPSGGALLDGRPDNRWHLVDHCKDVWADHFTRPDGAWRFDDRPVGTAAEGTAYAVRLGVGLTLVTVDVFTRTTTGVRLGVHDEQLDWLDATVRTAKARGDVVVVQGHVPTVWPVRAWHSGRLTVPEGRDSDLYRTLQAAGADVYLCGEVHDTTVRQRAPGEVTQVSHGCVLKFGFNYLVGAVDRERYLWLDYYEVPLLRATRERGLWCCDAAKRQPTEIRYGDPVLRGSLRLADRRIVYRTGKLGPYVRRDDPWSLSAYAETELV